MSNVISFNVYKNTLRRSSGNDPVSSESGYTEILCQFKEGDDWEGVNGGIVTAGFFVSEDNVEQMTANVVNREARFTIPGTLVGNRNPIYFGLAGSISTGENSYITIATNVVKLDVIRGVVIDRLSPDAEADENHYAQLLATLNTGLTNVYTKAQIDTRFELHLSVAFDENGVPVKWDDKATYSAGAFTGNKIVTAFVASNVTRLGGGTFAGCPNLTDVYIDKDEGTITIASGAIRDGVTVHYKGEFNAVGFIVRAMKYFEENKADKANVYTKAEVDVALAGKAATDHTHSEYLTAQDISGKYEKPSGGIPKTDLSSEVQASLGKADSALQSHQSLANYYNKTEVDGALAGKAAADHTHSEYLTAQDINGKEDKANKVESNMASTAGTGYPRAKYPSVYAVVEYLNNYYYSRSEINNTTYTKDEVNTALAEKAAANHTHSEYVTSSDISGKMNKLESGAGGKLIQSKEDGDVQRSTYDVSNSYNDILDMSNSKLPTCAAVKRAMNSVVPTYTSDLQNDSGFVTEAEMYTALDEKADSSDIPTKTSDLTNDSGFLTQHQDISGKEDKANKAHSFIFAGDGEEDEHGNVISIDHDAFYPSVKAVEDHLDLNYYTKSQVNTSLASKENTSARVTSISSSSTNSQYPTAKAVYDKILNQMLTLTEVRAPYAGASGETPRYKPGKWFVETGAAPVEGNIYTIKIPGTGITTGTYMSVHGTTDNDYYPIVIGGTSRLTNQFGAGVVITVIYETNKSASVYELESTTKNNPTVLYTGNVFRVLNYYDSGNTNTLLRTYALSVDKEFPLIGASTATSGTPATHTSSYKDLYGIIPSAAANKATINLSTGKITVPGGIAGNLDGSASSAPWSGVTGKPTTLSGYGITDAYTKAQVDSAIQTAIGGIENGSY